MSQKNDTLLFLHVVVNDDVEYVVKVDTEDHANLIRGHVRTDIFFGFLALKIQKKTVLVLAILIKGGHFRRWEVI